MFLSTFYDSMSKLTHCASSFHLQVLSNVQKRMKLDFDLTLRECILYRNNNRSNGASGKPHAPAGLYCSPH